MDQIVTLVNSITDCNLHTITLKPRFPLRKVFVGVRSHEWEERSELVKLNEKVVRWGAKEPGYVTATKRLASDAVLE